jgi:anthranilate synthase/phosphoribosyltransferase
MIVLVDNYDSFTFNLVQLIAGESSLEIEVVRNDAFEVDALVASRPDAIVISPGPGVPSAAGSIVPLVRTAVNTPILGICLGHQAIAEAFGGRIVRGAVPVHGKVDAVRHRGRAAVRRDVPTRLRVTRYHSLVAEAATLPVRADDRRDGGRRLRDGALAYASASRVRPAVSSRVVGHQRRGSDGQKLSRRRRHRMIDASIRSIVDGKGVSREEMRDVFRSVMDGPASEVQKTALIVALRMKGETAEEITGAAEAMRERVVPLDVNGTEVVDTCGTGGDGKGTINISTLAALVAAGAGVPIAKHGNRAVSSSCGSADVLVGARRQHRSRREGARERPPARSGSPSSSRRSCIPRWRRWSASGRSSGCGRSSTCSGPLTNPARAKRQVLGVYAPHLVPLLGKVLFALGATHAMVVHSDDGMDEISPSCRDRTSAKCARMGARGGTGSNRKTSASKRSPAGAAERGRRGDQRRDRPASAGRGERLVPRCRGGERRRGDLRWGNGEGSERRGRAGAGIDRQPGAQRESLKTWSARLRALRRSELSDRADGRSSRRRRRQFRRRAAIPAAEWKRLAEQSAAVRKPHRFRACASWEPAPSPRVIAEIKAASPSAGTIRSDTSIAEAIALALPKRRRGGDLGRHRALYFKGDRRWIREGSAWRAGFRSS